MYQATFTYKKVRQHEIKADVYCPEGNGAHPVVVWLHGGALVFGSRRDIFTWQRDLYLEAGFAVASVDYRLAPETKLPAIIDDLQDAFQWVREQGPALFGADRNRIAAVGHSAGGYLALMSGFVVDPAPHAIVSCYGFGDIVGAWLTKPDPQYDQQLLIPRQRAYRSVGRMTVSETPEPHSRFDFYLYLRQQGLWPQEVSGHDPIEEPGFFDFYCPLRNVYREFPPTLLLHGTADTYVPYEQSKLMAAAFAKAKVEHQLITIPGGLHGFDQEDTPANRETMGKVIEFLRARFG